jgi:arylsulfatase A-like enzyme
MGYQAVRTSRWKLIHYVDLDAMDELYDLRDDPFEMKNVIGMPGTQKTFERLSNEITRLAGEKR